MVLAGAGSPAAGSLTLLFLLRRSSMITALAAVRAARDVRWWWPHGSRSTGGISTFRSREGSESLVRAPGCGGLYLRLPGPGAWFPIRLGLLVHRRRVPSAGAGSPGGGSWTPVLPLRLSVMIIALAAAIPPSDAW